jgi:hypothetical protein
MRRTILLFAGAVIPAIAADLSVDRIEAVQVVQTTDYSIPFVAGKKTVARVFLKVSGSGGAAVGGVTAVLRGYRGASEMAGSPLRPSNGPIAAPVSPDRNETDHSLNFALPEEWTAAGTLNLTAEANPTRSVAEESYDNNTGTAAISFLAGGDLRLAHLRVCAAGGFLCPAPIGSSLADWLRKVFPVRDGGVEFYPLNITWSYPLVATAEERSEFLAAVSERRNLVEFAEARLSDRLVVWTPPALFSGLAGFDPLDLAGAGRAIAVADTSATDLPKQPQSRWFDASVKDADSPAITLAREVARNLGLRRAGSQEACGSEDMTGETGFDTAQMKAVSSARYDLMSYCYPPAENIWISPAHYRELFRADLAAPAATPPAEYAVVTGWAARDGSAGGLNPAYRITSIAAGAPPDSAGNHCLRFFGPEGRLAEYCFTLGFAAVRSGEAIEREHFSVKAPWPVGTVRLALMRGETELASLAATGSSPTVTILSPQAGEKWSGRKTIAWSASDSGGQPLRYAVLYSADGGSQWLPLDSGFSGTQLTVDTAEFEANAQVYLRVLATNGLETAAATAGPIEILAAPRMEIVSTALDFGKTPVGGTATLNAVVANRGSKALKVTGVQSDQKSFAAAGAAVVEVPARGTAEVAVSFRPTSSGEVSGTVSILGDDSENPALTVPVKGTGIVPRAEVSPASLAFGEVNAGEPKNLPLTLRNTGEAPLTVSAAARSNARFSGVSPTVPFSVASGGRQEIVIRFLPMAAGEQSGKLVLSTNDPNRAGITVALTGTGKALAGDARAEVSASIIEFGSIAIGQSKELTVNVNAVSVSPVTVSALSIDNARFTIVSPAAPFSVPAGRSTTVRIRFTPDSATAFRGALTITNNSTTKPTLTVALAGWGIPAGTAVLQEDDGSFEDVVVPYEGVSEVFMVNRLTPPSYPATLTKVQIYFHDRGDGPGANASIGLLYGAPDSSGQITSLRVMAVRVKETGRFNEYELTTPFTIESGDFAVGFHSNLSTGDRPAAIDITNAEKGRSLFSIDGKVFGPVPGVFGFRAVVTLGR